MSAAEAPAGFRPCVGVLLLDARGLAFAGRRAALPADDPHAWQMPQGGIDPGEDAAAAALRELEEETGIPPALARVEAVAPAPVLYDVPEALRPRHWAGRWRGQALTWVRLRFLGTDADIDVATAHPEFSAWAWREPAALADRVVPWKREAARAALALLD